MIKNKYIAPLFLALLPVMLPASQRYQQPSLSTVKFSTACGLPFFTHEGKKYFILSREAGGSDKGTYDDFGGKRDPGENHPIISSAREFWEEAILPCVGFSSAAETQKFIDPASNNTLLVISFGQSVTYVVDFTLYKDEFFKKFYDARNKARGHFREKDRIAIVEWDMLKSIIAEKGGNLNNVKLTTAVLNPKDLKWYQEEITLRPYFVKKMKSFATDSNYVQGENDKIRFYGLPRSKYKHISGKTI